MAKVFERQRLSAAQLRLVAQRRYDDADYLRCSGKNARANGVLYLGGFVIECLLKAKLVEQYPAVANERDPAKLAVADRELWNLLNRSHDLTDILNRLPDVRAKMLAVRHRGGGVAYARLQAICNEWTIFARYSTRTETMAFASAFLDNIKELRSWLSS